MAKKIKISDYKKTKKTIALRKRIRAFLTSPKELTSGTSEIVQGRGGAIFCRAGSLENSEAAI